MYEKTVIIPKSMRQIMHNTKIKKYPDGIAKFTVASRDIFRENGWEETSNIYYPRVKMPKPQNKDTETRCDSQKRAIDSIYDIIAMNRDCFTHFVTLTFNPEKIDSKSPKEVKKAVQRFLKNKVTRDGLKYLFVPELHKDGKIHLHGITNNALKLVDSGTRKADGYEKPMKIETLKRKGIPISDCKVVYNIPQWEYGFSMVEQISGSTDMIFGYITKYITKDLSKIFGNFYLAGGELIRKVPYELTDVDYATFECDKEVYCEPAKTSFKYLKLQN